MTSSTLSGNVLERHEVPLDEAFEVITDGVIHKPNILQQTLFPRLMTQDTGLLVITGPGAGKLEAIFVPSVMGMQTTDVAHRLFIIAPDGAPLDDYAYRLGPYLHCLVLADEVPRTIWFEEPERTPIAKTYYPNGRIVNGASHHPFSEDVDVIVMPFSHFRSLFFSSGGVHGVPEGTSFDLEAAGGIAPRGLFYFDDCYGATRAEQSEFIQLVEFLYAQDLDVVVGTSSMPAGARDDLSFLETVSVARDQNQPERLLQFKSAPLDQMIDQMVDSALAGYIAGSRVAITLNRSDDGKLNELVERLIMSHADETFLYRTLDSRATRTKVYTELMEREKQGKGYLLVVDGAALEASDLNLHRLISEPCSPLSLVRRAGRVKRRGDDPHALLMVLGDPSDSIPPHVTDETLKVKYIDELLRANVPMEFHAEMWQGFVG